jgi:hypothetical protein
MLASTLKGLMIHTADDLGTPGPDYQTGWGLINAKEAADLIKAQKECEVYGGTRMERMREITLRPNETFSYMFYTDGTRPIKATICWTDPPDPLTHPGLDDTTPVLINDFDIRVTDPKGNVYYPWTLPWARGTAPGRRPQDAAVCGIGAYDNALDNVEQIYIATPLGGAGNYTITVTCKDMGLSSGEQVSLLVTSNRAPVIISGPWVDPNPCAAMQATATVVAEDLDGDPLTYTWSLVSGPAADFTPNGAVNVNTTTVSFTNVGTYVLRATVADSIGSVSADGVVEVTGQFSSYAA